MIFLSLFLLFSGYSIGLGAVTVIDLHGFLGRTSSYWTEATIRTHKVTKPLIWVGTTLVSCGGLLWYISFPEVRLFAWIHAMIGMLLVVNGIFLSCWVSPMLLRQEKSGHAGKILSSAWQRNITISFLFSFFGWWGSLLLFVFEIYTYLKV